MGPITLTPTPAAGSYFAGWSDACTGVAGCAVTPTEDRTVTATFNHQQDVGTPCMVPEQCTSGVCADGVCCGGACGGSSTVDCVACSVAAGGAADGQCTAVTCVDDGDPCTAEACMPGSGCHVAVPGCTVDGGVSDAGSGDGSIGDGAIADSGEPEVPTTTFQGRGGCGCSLAATSTGMPWIALVSMVILLALRSRRKSGSRRR